MSFLHFKHLSRPPSGPPANPDARRPEPSWLGKVETNPFSTANRQRLDRLSWNDTEVAWPRSS